VKTTFDPIFPNAFRYWDVLLSPIIYFGQKRNLAEGLILTFLAAHIYSLCSMAPIGVFVFYYVIIMFVSRGVSSFFDASDWFTILPLLFSFSILSRVAISLLSDFFEYPVGFFSLGWYLPLYILMNTFMGFLTYLFLTWLDVVTEKAARNPIELGEANV
jgi:hypothetical protein